MVTKTPKIGTIFGHVGLRRGSRFLSKTNSRQNTMRLSPAISPIRDLARFIGDPAVLSFAGHRSAFISCVSTHAVVSPLQAGSIQQGYSTVPSSVSDRPRRSDSILICHVDSAVPCSGRGLPLRTRSTAGEVRVCFSQPLVGGRDAYHRRIRRRVPDHCWWADLYVPHTLIIGLGVVSVPAGLVASALAKARELEDA